MLWTRNFTTIEEIMIMIDNKSMSKLYRYEALLQAIDFFTQKFNLEQLSQYAFESANKILDLSSSALFILNGDFFEIRDSKYANGLGYKIPNTHNLGIIATLHGDIITSHFDRFFSPEDISLFNMKIVLPLIIKNQLYGFIISDGSQSREFEEDDFIVAHAFMQLMNNSLENSKIFSELQSINKKLDQKIFNLFSINQSSRVLLSVLDLNRLYSLSIDIFSELTSSKTTAFGLYDEISDRIIVRGYKNVFSTQAFYGEFELVSNEYKGYKIVFNYSQDKELLKKIFRNPEAFEMLEAEYIILLVRDRILGFVTISKPVNEREYDQALFELIESLASSTYISLKNAILFQEVNRQKNIIEQKLAILTKLGLLIKNLNSCSDIEELSNLTVRTLSIAFGIKKAFIALYDGKDFVIKDAVGFKPGSALLETNDGWERFSYSGSYFCFVSDSNQTYLSHRLLEEAGDSNCLIISPIMIDTLMLQENPRPLGYLVVLQTPESLREEEILLVDTIANSIAPTINHMNSMQQVKSEYLTNQRTAFIKALSAKYGNKESFLIDFYIYYKRLPAVPFTDPDLSNYEGCEYYYFDNILLALSEKELELQLFDGKLEGAGVEEITEKIKKL